MAQPKQSTRGRVPGLSLALFDRFVARLLRCDVAIPFFRSRRRGAAADGAVVADPGGAEIEALIANVWIVSSCWMDFRHGEGGAVTQAELAWGLAPVELLYRPYVRGGAAAGTVGEQYQPALTLTHQARQKVVLF